MRTVICAVIVSLLFVLCGCGPGIRVLYNDDWTVVFAIDGLNEDYQSTTRTYVGTKPGAKDGVDVNDQLAPEILIPEDLFVTSYRPDLAAHEYVKDYRAPLGIDQPRTWHIKVPNTGQRVLYAWNPPEHDITEGTLLILKDASGNELWRWEYNKNGSASEPAYAVPVEPGTELTLEAGLMVAE